MQNIVVCTPCTNIQCRTLTATSKSGRTAERLRLTVPRDRVTPAHRTARPSDSSPPCSGSAMSQQNPRCFYICSSRCSAGQLSKYPSVYAEVQATTSSDPAAHGGRPSSASYTIGPILRLRIHMHETSAPVPSSGSKSSTRLIVLVVHSADDAPMVENLSPTNRVMSRRFQASPNPMQRYQNWAENDDLNTHHEFKCNLLIR